MGISRTISFAALMPVVVACNDGVSGPSGYVPSASTGYAKSSDRLAIGYFERNVLDFEPSEGVTFTVNGQKFSFASGIIDAGEFKIEIVDTDTLNVTYEGDVYPLNFESSDIEAQGSTYSGSVGGRTLRVTIAPSLLYESPDYVMTANLTLAGQSLATGSIGFNTDPAVLVPLGGVTFSGGARVYYEIDSGDPAISNVRRTQEFYTTVLNADFAASTISGTITSGYNGQEVDIQPGTIAGNTFSAPIVLNGGLPMTFGDVFDNAIFTPSTDETMTGGFFGPNGEAVTGHSIMLGTATTPTDSDPKATYVQIGIYADR